LDNQHDAKALRAEWLRVLDQPLAEDEIFDATGQQRMAKFISRQTGQGPHDSRPRRSGS
jgi:hypothetical protein